MKNVCLNYAAHNKIDTRVRISPFAAFSRSWNIIFVDIIEKHDNIIFITFWHYVHYFHYQTFFYIKLAQDRGQRAILS